MRAKSVYIPPKPLTLHKLNYLTIDNRRVEIRKQRQSRRRSRVLLSYHPDGILYIDAPSNTTLRALRILIFRSEPWLRKEIEKYRSGDHVVHPSKYETGQILYVLGSPTTLRVHSRNSATVKFDGSNLMVGQDENTTIQFLVHQWYWELADTVLNATIQRICSSTCLVNQVPPWQHRFMRSKWGSCSSKGRMYLNTHLVKVPQEAIDMVVLHELCHFKELNHGPKFYELMNHYMPDWRQADKTLARFQKLLQEPLVRN